MEALILRRLGVFDDIDKEDRRTLSRLYVMWFLIASAFTILMTTLPLVLVEIAGPEEAAWYQGWLASTTAASGLVFCASLGHLSDRFGRTIILRVWSVAFAAGIVLVLVSRYVHSVGFLFVARLPAVSIPFFISSALCADILEGAALLKSHGHLGAIFGISSVVGAVGAGGVGHFFGLSAALILGLGFGLAGVTVAVFTRSPLQASNANNITEFFEALRIVYRDKPLRLLAFGLALLRVGNVNVMVIFIIYVRNRFGWAIFEFAMLMAIRGILGAYCMTAGTAYLANSSPRFINIAQRVLLALHVITMALMGLASNSWTFALASIINTVTFVSVSIFTAKISGLSRGEGINGLALGSVGTLQNIFEIPLAVLFGWVLERSISRYPRESVWAGSPFFLNALWYIIVCILWFYTEQIDAKMYDAAVNSDASTPEQNSV